MYAYLMGHLCIVATLNVTSMHPKENCFIVTVQYMYSNILILLVLIVFVEFKPLQRSVFAVLAFPIMILMSWSITPVLSITLSKLLRDLTSSVSFSPSLIGSLSSAGLDPHHLDSLCVDLEASFIAVV